MTIASDAAERLRALAEPPIAAAHLVCEDVTVRSRGGRTQALVVVDLPEDATGSVDLDTLAVVSRELSERLDADDSFLGSDPYEVEVTTPGAERPLTSPRHFRRARTRLVELRTTGGEEIVGRLREVTAGEDPELVVSPQPRPGAKPTGRTRPREDRRIPLSTVDSARVLLEFSPPAPEQAADTETPADAEHGARSPKEG